MNFVLTNIDEKFWVNYYVEFDTIMDRVRLAGADVKFDLSGRRAFLQYIRHGTEGSGKDSVEE